MLYTDGYFVKLADLEQVDREAVEVAEAEAVTVDGDEGIVSRATDECGKKLLSDAQLFHGFVGGGGVSSSHLAAVLNTGGPATTKPRFQLGQVVVSSKQHPKSWSSIKDWVVCCALERLYTAAFHRRVSDRYEAKAKFYANQIRARVWPRVLDLGIPIVSEPMPAPGAVNEYNSGTWDAANLSNVSGGATAETQYYVAVTYTDGSKYKSASDRGNAESGPSEILAFTVELNKLLRIDITSLNPPDGKAPKVGTSQGNIARLNATHWNVYVGSSSSKLYLQNASPIAIATKTYTLAAAPVLSGTLLDDGQYADSTYFIQQMVTRS